MIKRHVQYFAVAGLFAGLMSPASAQDTIKIGELNSYKAQPAFLDPYKKGWEMAIEEINAKGGVLGKKLEISRATMAPTPAMPCAWRTSCPCRAGRRADRHHPVACRSGGCRLCQAAQDILSRVGVADRQDRLGIRQPLHLPPATFDLYTDAVPVPHAAALKRKRWAFVYPNYEYGQSAVATFKDLLKKAQPDVEFVADLAPPLGKVDAGAVAQAIDDAKPDAIFNVLFGGDLAKFVREGNTRGVFKNRTVVSLLSGEPEYLDPLKDEAPVGWIVTGYPWDKIKTKDHLAFVDAYKKKYNDYPRLGSIVGYVTMTSLAAGIAKAKSTDTEKLVEAFKDLKVDSPFGPFRYRASDHQATMGAYVGKIALEGGKGTMADFQYVDGATVLPSDAEVIKLRPTESN